MSLDAPHTRGPVVAIGGAEDKMRSQVVLRRVVDMAGGDDAHLVVVPTASRLEDTGARYCRVFREIGAADVRELPLRRRSDGQDPASVAAIERATGVFMTGGNQVRLSSILGGTAVAAAIRRRNADGAVIAGTSAGAAFLSEHMIAYGREGATPRAGMVAVVPGLGLIGRVIVDQHFRQRDRLGRLLTALAYNPFCVGIGVDEDTAAVVVEDHLEVIGSNALTLVDPTGLEHSGMGSAREGEAVTMIGLCVHVLTHGSRYDLRARRAAPPSEPPSAEALRAADADVRGMHDEGDADEGD